MSKDKKIRFLMQSIQSALTDGHVSIKYPANDFTTILVDLSEADLRMVAGLILSDIETFKIDLLN